MSSLRFAVSLVLAIVVLSGVDASLYEPDLRRTIDQELEEAGSELYDEDRHDYYEAQDADFEEVFPNHGLYVAAFRGRLPAMHHAFAMREGSSLAFDLTRDWNALMNDDGTQILASSDALKVGEAYAMVANVEFQFTRFLVNASWSTALGVSAHDPRVTSGLGAWTVELQTWSPENGVLVSWSMQFSTGALGLASLTSAWWKVDAVATGEFDPTPEAVNLQPGIRVTNTYASHGHALKVEWQNGTTWTQSRITPLSEIGPCSLIVERMAFDGTTIEACYADASSSVPESIATAGRDLVDAAVAAYDRIVEKNEAPCASTTNAQPNLGQPFRNDSCRLQIVVLAQGDVFCTTCLEVAATMCDAPPACAVGGRIIVSPLYKEYLLALGLYTDPTLHTSRTVARSILAHEMFHLVQHSTLGSEGPGYWITLLEGQARFVETLLEPDANHHPSSLFFHPTPTLASNVPSAMNSVFRRGAQVYQIAPTVGPCSMEYASAPFWGTGYAANGGATFLEQALRSSVARDRTRCEPELGHALNATLANLTGADADAAALLDRSAFQSYSRAFTWQSLDGAQRDWGAFLVPVANSSISAGSTKTIDFQDGWGRAYLRLPPADVQVACPETGPHSVSVFTRGFDGTYSRATVACGADQGGAHVAGGTLAEAVIAVVSHASHAHRVVISVA